VIAFPAGDAFFAGQVKSTECRERVGEALQAVTRPPRCAPPTSCASSSPADQPPPPPSDDEWVDRFKSAFNAEEIEAS